MSEELEQVFQTNENQLGVVDSPKDLRDYKACVISKSAKFPKEFKIPDWNVKVKNQGNVGSCVAHSLAELVEYFNYKQEGQNIQMSTDYIYGNRLNMAWKTHGMPVRFAIENLVNYGDLTKEQYPGNTEAPKCIDKFESRDLALDNFAKANRVSTYYTFENDDAMKQHLMTVGPIIFTVKWPTYYILSGKNKVVKQFGRYYVGGHCLIMYGWNEDGWLFQNSWGTIFGKKGSATWPFGKDMMDAYGITDDVVGEDQGLYIKKSTWWAKAIMAIVKFIQKLSSPKNSNNK